MRADDPRTLDLARQVLSDIGELDRAEYRILHLNDDPRLPALYIIFDYPEQGAYPTLTIPIVHLATGNRFSDDKLRGIIRRGVERYLAHIGRPRVANPSQVLLSPAGGQGDGRVPR